MGAGIALVCVGVSGHGLCRVGQHQHACRSNGKVYRTRKTARRLPSKKIYSVTHEERQPQEIENYTYVDYTENVEYVYSHKDLTYIVGYPDESVRPDASMTRAEATTVFYRLYDGEYPEFERRMSNGTFEDVKTDYWFYKEVETLYNIGIVDGTDEHKFSPDAPVTRAEFAVMAARFANLDYEGGNLFDDVPNGHWAYSYINAAANAGWVEATRTQFSGRMSRSAVPRSCGW